MTPARIIAFVLIVLGAVGLAVGKFSYTKETHGAKVGPLELTVKEKDSISIPPWLGVGVIVLGAAVLLVSGKKR